MQQSLSHTGDNYFILKVEAFMDEIIQSSLIIGTHLLCLINVQNHHGIPLLNLVKMLNLNWIIHNELMIIYHKVHLIFTFIDHQHILLNFRFVIYY